MRVRFLKDFRGRETGEQFYQIGEEAEIDNPDNLLLNGWVEKVAERKQPATKPEPESKPEPTKTVSKRKR